MSKKCMADAAISIFKVNEAALYGDTQTFIVVSVMQSCTFVEEGDKW
jgi:hypothetical protein